MKSFQQVQRQFAARIRNPEQESIPSAIEPRRMQVYEELFFNNLEDLLSSNFPVLSEVLEDRWMTVVRAFLQQYRCHTPLFGEIPREFLDFLLQQSTALQLPPFSEELAHYEWVEIEVAAASENLQRLRRQLPQGGQGDVMQGVPLLSPLVRLLSYHWPVHQISADFRPDSGNSNPVWLLVWRDERMEVRFAEINETVVWLLQQIQSHPRTGEQLVADLARLLGREDLEVLQQYARQLLDEYMLNDVLLGVQSCSA